MPVSYAKLLSREQWMLAELIKTAARCADATFCANDENGQPEYNSYELECVAFSLMDKQNGVANVSRNQLENLQAIIELALRSDEKRKPKHNPSEVTSIDYTVTPPTTNPDAPDCEIAVFTCCKCRRVSAIETCYTGNKAPINCPHCGHALRVRKP